MPKCHLVPFPWMFLPKPCQLPLLLEPIYFSWQSLRQRRMRKLAWNLNLSRLQSLPDCDCFPRDLTHPPSYLLPYAGATHCYPGPASTVCHLHKPQTGSLRSLTFDCGVPVIPATLYLPTFKNPLRLYHRLPWVMAV